LLSDSAHPQVLQTVTVTPGRPAPHVDVNVGLADVGATGGGPATSTPPPPTKDEHGTLWHLWNDHNIVTDIAYEFNKFNPLAKVTDLGYTILQIMILMTYHRLKLGR